MKKITILVLNLQGLDNAASQFLHEMGRERIVAFYGEMGAGKTTFIKALCEKLGVVNMVNSPSFAIINEYFTRSDEVIYHIDLYRLKSVTELLDIGYEEYISGSGYCFIEWPEKAEEILPDRLIRVHIARNLDESRLLTIEIPED